jgi:hypothetical protein
VTPSQKARGFWKTFTSVVFISAIAWLFAGWPLAVRDGVTLSPIEFSTGTLFLLVAMNWGFLWGVQKLAQGEVQGIVSSMRRDGGTSPAVFLFLRSFDVGRSSLLTRAIAELSFSRSILFRRHDAEEKLAEAIGSMGHLLAIGDKRTSYGAAKLIVRDHEWQTTFRELVERAKAIFVLPGPSEAVMWEIEQLARTPLLLAKVVFVMPREGTQDWGGGGGDKQVWYETVGLIARATGIMLPDYDENGCYLRVRTDGRTETVALDLFTSSLAAYARHNHGPGVSFNLDDVWPEASGRQTLN